MFFFLVFFFCLFVVFFLFFVFFLGGGGVLICKLLKLRYRMIICIGVGKILGMPDISDIFFVGGGRLNSRCWVEAYVSKNESTPTPLGAI